MNRQLQWKLCLIVALGTVSLFYLVNRFAVHTQERMSYISEDNKLTLQGYAKKAEALYLAGDMEALHQWLLEVQDRENTWVAVVRSKLTPLAGGDIDDTLLAYYGIGRSVKWMLHPWLVNPIMEMEFAEREAHFLIRLPDRMRPNLFRYLGFANLALQIILPLILLTAISVMLYRHIMDPLKRLEMATRRFASGRFDTRAREFMGNRSDELAQLAATFDRMAERTGELITGQRQLISDLSHELRTPLARLDIAIENLRHDYDSAQGLEKSAGSVERVERESRQLRKLVEDTLTLAWLENERPQLMQETLDLVDLLDVVVEDARFEFPDRRIHLDTPETAPLHKSDHRLLAQAVENITRNALRFTPEGKTVSVALIATSDCYRIEIRDQGPGVEVQYLEKIFEPFFRIDSARSGEGGNFGLGLALAKRQIRAGGGEIKADNPQGGGLRMIITLPRQAL